MQDNWTKKAENQRAKIEEKYLRVVSCDVSSFYQKLLWKMVTRNKNKNL